MKQSRLPALLLAAIMLASCLSFLPAKNAVAAETVKATSFKASENGIEVGTSQTVTFTAELENQNVSDLKVVDENGNTIARLGKTADGTYSASAEIAADKKGTHTYTLNTDNGEEFAWEFRFYNPLTALDLRNDDITWANVSAITTALSEKDASDESLLKRVYEYLSSDENVEKVWYETETIINFVTNDGISNIYDAAMLKHNRNTISASSDESEESSSENLTKAVNNFEEKTKSDEYIGSKDICIIAPYYGVESDFTQSHLIEAQNLSKVLKGGTITAFYGDGSLTGKKADLAAFKNLDKYGFISIDSHGSLYNGQSLICVNYTTGASAADYSSGRLVRYTDPYDSFYDYVGVLAPYITHYTNSLPDSIVYMGSCYGMHSTHLYQAFRNLGAVFVTGYTQSVAFVFDRQIFAEYTKRLRSLNTATGKLYTTKEAFDAAVDRFGDTDPYGSEQAVWKYNGNTNIRLCEYYPNVAVESIEVSPESATLSPGETLQLSVTTAPSNAIYSVTTVWETFNKSIATVDENGLVTAKKAGSTTIICTIVDYLGNTFNGSVSITVEAGACTVTFVDGLTGETIATQTVEAGEDAQAPEVPNHDGYVFYGWDKALTNIDESVTITALYYAYGDVTLDGKINTGDATGILKYAADMIDFDDKLMLIADSNHDGAVNTGDALTILRISAS